MICCARCATRRKPGPRQLGRCGRKRVCLSSVSQTHHSELHMAHPSGNPDRPSVMQAFSGLSNDEFEILGNADRFAQAELYPLAQRMDDEEWWPTEIFPKIGATGYFRSEEHTSELQSLMRHSYAVS